MTYEEFKEKFLPEFSKIRTFAGKIKYADQNLTRIGSGSGRAVYDIDGTKVLKVAKNPKGIAQNEIEAPLGNDYYTKDIVTEVFDNAEDDSWLIAEKAKKVSESRIKQLTGIPSLARLYQYLRYIYEQSVKPNKNYPTRLSQEELELFYENEFASGLGDLIGNYNHSYGDMGRPSTYGEVIRNGQPTIVLTDYGLSDEVYSQHYDSSRKKKYYMYELYQFADGNDDILSDIGNTGEVRHAMWAQVPYDIGDGDGVINEQFVHFVSNRDYYPEKPLETMPYLVENFHECINNLKEALNIAKDKKRFYNNLLKLQEYLINQKWYNREPLGEIREEKLQKNIITEGLDAKLANEIAIEVAQIKGLNSPRYLGCGFFGCAYDIGGDKVLKITSDADEAYSNMKLIGKPLKYIAKPFNVYKIKSESGRVGDKVFAIILEKLETDEDKFSRLRIRLDFAFDKILGLDLNEVLADYAADYNIDHIMQKINTYMRKNPEDAEFFYSLIRIADEVKSYGINTIDYINPKNLGYMKNGAIGFFDAGGGYEESNVRIPAVGVNEDGAAKFSQTDSIGRDDFPTYNQNDTSPMTDNNIPTTNEDLEYRHADDATQDEFTIDEDLEFIGGSDMTDDTHELDENEDVLDYNVIKRNNDVYELKSSYGRAIGVIHNYFYDYVDWKKYEEPEIYLEFLDASEVGKGYGKIVLMQVIDYALKNNLHYISSQSLNDFSRKTFENLENEGILESFLNGLHGKTITWKILKNPFNNNLNERILSAMKGSSAVEVKKKCRLGGLGNTSVACNQGDISNLNIKSLEENSIRFNETVWAWVSPDNRLIRVPKLNHKGYIMGVYKDYSWDYDKVFDKAIEDGWVRVIYEYFPERFKGSLSLNGYDKERVVSVFKSMFYDLVKYGGNSIYLEYENPKGYDAINTSDADGKRKLMNIIGENELIDEEIHADYAKEYNNAMQAMLDGKKDVSTIAFRIRPELRDVAINNDFGLIPVKQDRSNVDMNIVYRKTPRGEANAKRLYQIMMSHGGYAADQTPEEAREIGMLLDYTNDSINQYIQDKYENIDDEILTNEGVGDTYAEKFGAEPEFSGFEDKYRSMKNVEHGENIVYRGANLTIIKNPKSLENIGSEVRGVVDKKGNIYLEEKAVKDHDFILKMLAKRGYIEYVPNWYLLVPTEFITIQRYWNNNMFFIGEGNLMMHPDDDRVGEDNGVSQAEAKPVFGEFIKRAKIKNPNIKIFNERAQDYENDLRESKNILNFADEKEEMIKEAQIIISNINEAKSLM